MSATTTLRIPGGRSRRLLKPPEFLPLELRVRLLANGKAGHARDHIPVVKFFDPAGPATWLITEIRPDDPDVIYGLIHDARMERSPTLGYASLSDLRNGHGPSRDPVERDPHFAPRYPLSVYFAAARILGNVSEDTEILYLIASGLGVIPVPSRATSASRRSSKWARSRAP